MDFETRGSKIKRVILISALGVLIVGILALGYLYYLENTDKKELAQQNKELQDRYDAISAKLEGEIDELTGGATSAGQLKSENDSLKEDNADYKAGMTKIRAYNDVFKFYNTVIETHGGYTGWTDAEFQTGRALAEKTGDASFVSTINWAWYETSIPPFNRVLRFQEEIASGIESGLR